MNKIENFTVAAVAGFMTGLAAFTIGIFISFAFKPERPQPPPQQVQAATGEYKKGVVDALLCTGGGNGEALFNNQCYNALLNDGSVNTTGENSPAIKSTGDVSISY
jgi:hypothetical protein